MLKFNELQNGKEYIAIGDNGREYKGTFVDDYFPGGGIIKGDSLRKE